MEDIYVFWKATTAFSETTVITLKHMNNYISSILSATNEFVSVRVVLVKESQITDGTCVAFTG